MSLREKLTGRRVAGDGRRSEKRQAAVERKQGRAARRAEVAEQARAVRESMRSQAAALEMAPSKQTPGTFVHLYSSQDLMPRASSRTPPATWWRSTARLA